MPKSYNRQFCVKKEHARVNDFLSIIGVCLEKNNHRIWLILLIFGTFRLYSSKFSSPKITSFLFLFVPEAKTIAVFLGNGAGDIFWQSKGVWLKNNK